MKTFSNLAHTFYLFFNQFDDRILSITFVLVVFIYGCGERKLLATQIQITIYRFYIFLTIKQNVIIINVA